MPARLTEIDWPDNGAPPPPKPTAAVFRPRLAALRAAMEARAITHLVIYGDREHFANLAWATGFDPRFEEALFILPGDGTPLIVAGTECFPYTLTAPLVADGTIARECCASLSLISQPRHHTRRLEAILDDAIPAGARVGTVGWKYFAASEVADPAAAIEIPALFADLLRARAARVENATDLLMHPGRGLRASLTPDEIAAFEFANHLAATAARALIFGLRDGITDHAALAAARLPGAPLSCHVTLATGARAGQGLASPSGEIVARGRPMSFNIAPQGANICRAGWVAEDAADLPEPARDYVEAFAGPYLAALSAWFDLLRPGTPGHVIWSQIRRDLPFETFGVFLNPGHLIHLDEWLSSPIAEGSTDAIRAGMAIQSDIIPANPVYGSTRMEEGYVILDAALAAALARSHPGVLERGAARRRFMRATIGLAVPDCVLPLADTAGLIPPFFLAPRRVLTLA